MSLRNYSCIAQPLYTRFRIMFSSWFPKVTIGFIPTRTAPRRGRLRRRPRRWRPGRPCRRGRRTCRGAEGRVNLDRSAPLLVSWALRDRADAPLRGECGGVSEGRQKAVHADAHAAGAGRAAGLHQVVHLSWSFVRPKGDPGRSISIPKERAPKERKGHQRRGGSATTHLGRARLVDRDAAGREVGRGGGGGAGRQDDRADHRVGDEGRAEQQRLDRREALLACGPASPT